MTNTDMKTTPLIIAITACLAVPAFAGTPVAAPAPAKAPIECHSADPCLSYDFIDLDYGIGSHDNAFFDDNGHQFGVAFSKSLGETFFLTGSYTNAGFDYLFNNQYLDFTSHRLTLGLGAHFSLAECLDLTLEGGASYRDNQFTGNANFDYDSWGYYVGPGLRARVGRLEGFAKVFYFDREGVLGLSGVDVDGWVFQPGVLFHLTDTVAFKVAGDIGENFSAATFGLRLHF